MRRTVLYRPESDEETEALIAETRDAMIDNRVRSSVNVGLHRMGIVEEPITGDANATSAALRGLLPGDGYGDPQFRLQYGWSGKELAFIVSFLHFCEDQLREAGSFALRNNKMLSGTGETLIRDADKLKALIERWLPAGLDKADVFGVLREANDAS